MPLRGNVETRLKKVESGEVAATLLTSAGLNRLGIDVGTPIPVEIILPAPGQAAIGMECRTDDMHTQTVLSPINNEGTFAAVMAERAFARALGGSCHSPVAALAVLDEGELHLRAQLLSEDGSDIIEDQAMFECGNNRTPEDLARAMLERATESIRRLFTAA